MFKRKKEIEDRKTELRGLVNTLSGKELDTAIEEMKKMDSELTDIEKRARVLNEFADGCAKNALPVEKLKNNEVKERVFKRDSVEYRNAFYKVLLGFDLNEPEKRAMTTVSSSGGSAIPTMTMNKILEKLKERSIVYNLVSVSHFKGNITIPYEGVTNDVERKAEGSDGSYKDDTLAGITLSGKKYIKLVRLTCELDASAIDALEDYVVGKLVKKLELAFDADIINGSGVNSCKGILQDITLIETETAKELAYDDICNLFAELSAAAKKNAVLMMSTNTLYKQVKKIKDNDGKPIFNPDNNIVLGREVVECDEVPDGTVIFGDFSEYQFNWSKDIEIVKSSEAAFESGDIVFRGLALVDGALADLGAMAALKVKEAEQQ